MAIPDLTSLQILQVPIEAIRPHPKNPMKHPAAQLRMLKASVSRYGAVVPSLVAEAIENGKPYYDLITGHARQTVYKELGFTTVPVIVLSHLTPEGQMALRIFDNSISKQNRWSTEFLTEHLGILLNGDLEFSVDELGFEMGEVDFFIGAKKPKRAKGEGALPANRALPSVTMTGDVWLLGKHGEHKVLCGNAIDRAAVERLMGDDRADTGIFDMPWNRPGADIGGLGATIHPDFQMGSGEMSTGEFLAFVRSAFTLQAEYSRPGALHYQFIDWRSVADFILIGREVYDALINLCVWAKNQPGMGSLYRSQHELACVFRVKGGKHDNFVNLGKHGRNRSNIWSYPAASSFGSERSNLALHPTPKNPDMIADAIMDSTKRKGLVLDTFLGSGTTLIAAHRTGRRCRAIEIDPHYVDVAVRRFQEETGIAAQLEDGRTFDEIEKEGRDNG